jgi:hypothetical protein
LHDYFTAKIVKESEDYLSGKKTLDAKALEKEEKEEPLPENEIKMVKAPDVEFMW